METGLVPREGDARFLGVKNSSTWLDMCCVEINRVSCSKLVLYYWEEPILCDPLNCCSSGVFVKIERSKPRASSWVLQLVKDIHHYVGLSSEGFEGELMALLTTIEASHN
jgi:hypothetical protein